jgi:hypothetical protein
MDGIPLTEELKSTLTQFYVYAYLRQRNSPIGNAGTPYYIGKGKYDRAWGKHGKTPVPKDISRIIIVGHNLTEEEAFILEVKMIADYGRVDNNTGILRNLTDGGEGTSGWIAPEDFKRNIGKVHKGRIVITNGIKDKQIYPTDPIPSGWKIGRKPYTDAWKVNLGKTTKGKIHITDGINERRIYPTDPIPSGWKIGRSSRFKGKIIITDGINERRIYPTDPIPSGWKIGRCPSAISNAAQKGRIVSVETRRKISDFYKRKRNTVASGSDIYAFLDGTS